MERIKLDMMGKTCPIPVVEAKKALDREAEAVVLEIHVDNEIAVQNLRKLAESQNCAFEYEKAGEKQFQVLITRQKRETEPECPACETLDLDTYVETAPEPEAGYIVVISSEGMGTGNGELGKVLMKGFLYALAQKDQLPEKILFYNGGVTWSTEGADPDALADLKDMEERGVEIYSCGTCLDYYGLSEKLQVGSVTNMYSIVEAMTGAAKLIRP